VTYARVSTNDQEIRTQTEPLGRYVESRGWRLVAALADVGIGGDKTSRPGLDEAIRMARAREVDVVVVARFDRWSRVLRHLVLTLDELRTLGVQWVSLAEPLDTTTPIGRFQFALLGALAEFERAVIRERIAAGMDRARREGRLGRPRVEVPRELVERLRARGLPWSSIAKAVGVGKSTLDRARAEWNAEYSQSAQGCIQE